MSGEIEVLDQPNRHVLAFLRRCGDDVVLVVANLSRHAQPVQLELARLAGRIPVEAFGRVEFPRLTAGRWQLTLSRYGFYWFVLRKQAGLADGTVHDVTQLAGSFDELFTWHNRAELAAILLGFLQRSAKGTQRRPTRVTIVDLFSMGPRSCLTVLRVSFTAGDSELHLLPVSMHTWSGDTAQHETIATIRDSAGNVNDLCRELTHGCGALLQSLGDGRAVQGVTGVLRADEFAAGLPAFAPEASCLLPNAPLDRSQRNSSVLLGGLYVLKMYRHIEAGDNPEPELLRFLFEDASYSHAPPAFGKLRYTCSDGEVFDAGMLQAMVTSRSDLWRRTLDELALYMDRAASLPRAARRARSQPESLIQSYIALVELLGKRTAELHLALSSSEAPPFAPEPFDSFYLRGAAHLMTSRASFVAGELEAWRPELPPNSADTVSEVTERLASLEPLFRSITGFSDIGMRMRVHGDLHLGQVLDTGDDVVFIDFEGDNSRPLSERRLKMSPLVDVAGMVFSFQYAAASARFNRVAGVFPWRGFPAELRRWTDAWYHAVCSLYVNRYRQMTSGSTLMPSGEEPFWRLLHIYVAAKAVYQLGYELSHRPEWVPIAMTALLEITDEGRMAVPPPM